MINLIMLNATPEEPVVLNTEHIESIGATKATEPLKSPASIRMVSGQYFIVTQTVEEVLVALTAPSVPAPGPSYG